MVIPHVCDVLRQLDPDAALYHVAPMEQVVANSISRQRLYAVIVGVFAAVALALAAFGVFGLIAYAVARPTREIGIRMALGATRLAVMSLLIRESVTLATIGIVIGLIGAAALSGSLRHMLFGVTPSNPTTFIGVSLSSRRLRCWPPICPFAGATHIDPLIALRDE